MIPCIDDPVRFEKLKAERRLKLVNVTGVTPFLDCALSGKDVYLQVDWIESCDIPADAIVGDFGISECGQEIDLTLYHESFPRARNPAAGKLRQNHCVVGLMPKAVPPQLQTAPVNGSLRPTRNRDVNLDNLRPAHSATDPDGKPHGLTNAKPANKKRKLKPTIEELEGRIE